MKDRDGDAGPVPTVTHAKLRAEQGDVATARRILETILAKRPGDPEARAMLDRLRATRGREYSEIREDAPPPPEPARAAELSARFRAALGAASASPEQRVRRRLEDMLIRIGEIRGGHRAR